MGGQYLLQHYYKQIHIWTGGEYYFKEGKKFNWSDYNNEKQKYTVERIIQWDKKEDFDEWVLLKHKESDLGGYKWGNYYKSWVRASFKNFKLVIEIKYEIAAYGVGSNWYWSAGNVSASKIKFIAR